MRLTIIFLFFFSTFVGSLSAQSESQEKWSVGFTYHASPYFEMETAFGSSVDVHALRKLNTHFSVGVSMLFGGHNFVYDNYRDELIPRIGVLAHARYTYPIKRFRVFAEVAGGPGYIAWLQDHPEDSSREIITKGLGLNIFAGPGVSYGISDLFSVELKAPIEFARSLDQEQPRIEILTFSPGLGFRVALGRKNGATLE